MTVTAAAADTEIQPYRWRWVALFVILAAEVMDLLDALVTTIASVTIRQELGGSDSLVQWLGAGYTLAMAVGLITGGRLGDLYGRKRMFVIGAAGFTAASLLCGVAVSPEMLIASRVLQGLFGSVMIPQGLGLIKEMFPPRELGKAFGMFGPVMTISSVGGPVLAGWLVDADFFGTGWRMIFLINLPIGLAAVLAALRFLPEYRLSNATRLDLVGTALVSAAAFLLVFPLIQGQEQGWPVWTFVSMAASIVMFVVFGRYESRRARAGRDPLVTPSLFRKRAFTGGMVAGLAFFSGMMGLGLVFNLYVQGGLGFTPLQAGLTGLPQALGGVVGFGLAMSGLQEKLGRGLLQIGTLVMGAGAAVLALTIHLAGLDVSSWQLAPGLALVGVGMGLTMAPFFDIVLAGVEPHESGSASGTLTGVQQLGGALGTAVLGTIFFNLLAKEWDFGSAMQVTVWVEVGLLALTFGLSYLLPRRARPEQAGH
ncbi:DHA2 family efflux MFS transporter permease subunit [Nonomuraea zeae]|uniref:DHA2 family efflux MFS transporter permease subunit n=1 Tax=Nonomuraea zeae TaxID=1642303 RepID=A0A5S4GBX0_9ACTN|nr:DHA2 family efflux MFS transporter permease subunit [Nonomuraea zeae]TMR30515.1 DHA2 family efflux MFS transporter permease subunit [Nonomuraea zeae]